MSSRWPTTLDERIEARSVRDPETGCLLYMGARQYGYGVLRGGVFLHRWEWEKHNGPIPVGLFICHRCDVRNCREITHLFIGTKAANAADRDGKKRQAFGERHGRAKLTDADVIAIRASGQTNIALSAIYGVDHRTISYVRRVGWRHV